MEAVTIYYSIVSGGDGSAYLKWFITEEACDEHQEDQNQGEGWAEDCTGSIETFVHSETYNEALKSEADWIDSLT